MHWKLDNAYNYYYIWTFLSQAAINFTSRGLKSLWDLYNYIHPIHFLASSRSGSFRVFLFVVFVFPKCLLDRAALVHLGNRDPHTVFTACSSTELSVSSFFLRLYSGLWPMYNTQLEFIVESDRRPGRLATMAEYGVLLALWLGIRPIGSPFSASSTHMKYAWFLILSVSVTLSAPANNEY